jgi:hypothetical protein
MWMIETHTLNSFLRPEVRVTEWFRFLNFANGLVAPAFLFIAGYVQGLAVRRRQSAPIKKTGTGWKRVKRLLFIALLGYCLHVQWAALFTGRFDIQAAWSSFAVDVLQCLAFSLIALLGLEKMSGSPRKFDLVLCVLLPVVVFVSPCLESWKFTRWFAAPFAAYLNQQNGSLFPLFPWAGFVFAGALMSGEPLPGRRFLALAGACWIAAWLGSLLPGTLYPTHNPYSVGPRFFIERLGWLLALAPCFVWLQNRFSPRVVLFAGRESLVLYVTHLVILYCSFSPGGSLAQILGKTHSLPATLAMFAALLLLSLSVTFLFQMLQAKLDGRAQQ